MQQKYVNQTWWWVDVSKLKYPWDDFMLLGVDMIFWEYHDLMVLLVLMYLSCNDIRDSRSQIYISAQMQNQTTCRK